MKKLIAVLLSLALVAAMAAGCAKDNATNETTTEATTTVPEVQAPATALEVLETIWGLYGEDEKFPVFGGDGANMVDGAPGAYTDMEALTSQLLVPADQADNVTEIASLFHGMMLNNFSCGVFKLAEGVDAAAFADMMHDAVAGNQWMCGFPEKELIAIVGGEYVLMAFGLNDAIEPFESKLTEAYPDAQIKYSAAIEG